jgi:tetratricopeptide (TPR) repeat protein
MRKRRIFTIGLAAVTAALPCAAGDFGRIHRAVVTIQVARPPEVLLRGKSFAVKSTPGVPVDNPPGVEQAIVRALSSVYTPAPASPDLTITVTVTSYQRIAPKLSSQVEKRSVKVRKTIKNPITGKPVAIDTTEIQDVPVTRWEGQGSLGAHVVVRTASGVQLDEFTPNAVYSKRIELAEGRTPKGKAPPPQESLAELQQALATEIGKRYVKTAESLEVLLAMDDPLHPGNDLAVQKRWKEALDRWTAVPPNGKIQADRLYNLGVAQEALGYAAYNDSGNPENAEPLFQQAIRNYEDALKLDPAEKYFVEAKDRCTRIRANFARAKEQYDAIQRQAAVLEIKEKQKEAAVEAQKEEEAARRQREQEQKLKDEQELTSTRPDSPDEAEFRSLARVKLKSQAGKPGEKYVAQLEENGRRDYKLTAVQSKRVVTQEVARLDGLQEYRETFKELIARDKTIDAGERDTLRKFAARKTLTADEVKSIESEFEFKDLTAPTVVEAKSPAPRPPAPKPTATRPPAPKPAAPKPSIPAQPDSSIKR